MSDFNTKSTILRPRAVKLQSPPYPVTGSNDEMIVSTVPDLRWVSPSLYDDSGQAQIKT